MSAGIRNHIRSNIVGYIALFVAIGGGSVALGATSSCTGGMPCVNSDDIINGQVETQDVGNDQVRSADVANDTTPYALTGGDISNANGGALTGTDIRESTLQPPPRAIVARTRGTTTQTATNSDVNYPLSGNTWTQQANESDLGFGQVTYTPPANCDQHPGQLAVTVLVDGKFVSSGYAFAASPSPNPFALSFFTLFEPGSNTNRTITVQIHDDCFNEHYKVTSVKVDVIGVI
jgi:hypothetical protein